MDQAVVGVVGAVVGALIGVWATLKVRESEKTAAIRLHLFQRQMDAHLEVSEACGRALRGVTVRVSYDKDPPSAATDALLDGAEALLDLVIVRSLLLGEGVAASALELVEECLAVARQAGAADAIDPGVADAAKAAHESALVAIRRAMHLEQLSAETHSDVASRARAIAKQARELRRLSNANRHYDERLHGTRKDAHDADVSSG